MKVGLALDGLLTDTEALRTEWSRRLGDEKFLRDTAFWAALKPYEDVFDSVALMLSYGWDIYVLVERPKTLLLPTRAWLRNNAGLVLNKDRIIMQAIKRFDCRMEEIPVLFDSDPGAIENLKVETVVPCRGYLVDRSQGGSLFERVEQAHAEHHSGGSS